MVRFIFVCMAVTALSILSIAGQSIFDGIRSARQDIMARNEKPEASVVAVTSEDIAAEELNTIETASGSGADEPGNQTFGNVFLSEPPKALQEPAASSSETITAPLN